MPLLTKDQILAAQDRQYKEVDVPEWGGVVRLASFDADQALRHNDLMKSREDGKGSDINPLSAMVAASVVDEHGNRLFEEKDMMALGKKNPTVIIRLVNLIKALNAMKDDDEAVGNSEASPTDA